MMDKKRRGSVNGMPVIPFREAETASLAPALMEVVDLRELVLPYDASEMEAYEVSRLVDSPGQDLPDCIARIR